MRNRYKYRISRSVRRIPLPGKVPQKFAQRLITGKWKAIKSAKNTLKIVYFVLLLVAFFEGINTVIFLSNKLLVKSTGTDNCVLLGYYAESRGSLPTFRHNLPAPSSGVKNPNILDYLPTFRHNRPVPSSGVKNKPFGLFTDVSAQPACPIFRCQESKLFGLFTDVSAQTAFPHLQVSRIQTLWIIYRRFGTTCLSHLQVSRIQTIWILGPIDCAETSVNYRYSPRKTPEERRSHLFRGESLKSLVALSSVRFALKRCGA